MSATLTTFMRSKFTNTTINRLIFVLLVIQPLTRLQEYRDAGLAQTWWSSETVEFPTGRPFFAINLQLTLTDNFTDYK